MLNFVKILGYILTIYYICKMKANNRDKGKSGIYIIRNIINGKVYIGKAKCIFNRIKQHITNLNRKDRRSENDHFINSWHKYGRSNFSYSVLEYLPLDNNIISSKEIEYIDKYNSLNSNLGYNKRYDSSTGLIVSQETRDKLSKACKLRNKKFPNLRKQVSEKMSKYWKDNPKELQIMADKVALKTRKFKIGKFSYENNDNIIIEEFNSRKELLNKYPDYYIQAILGCCQGTKKSYKGFKWKYISIETNEIIERKYDYKPKYKNI